MAEITLRGVAKRYGDTPVLHGIDLHIPDGTFVVVVGESGCGKSTLLRLIAGLETVTEGDIVIGGRVVNGIEPKDRDIAMVFQNYALYPHMSVADNMAYGLRIRGMGKAEIQRRVHEVADVLGLTNLLDRKPRALSGGQRQRVAMGRAIIRQPSVFLFDEPLSNLDAKLRVQMRLEIQRLHARLATTSLYVTHDQVEAMTLAEQLVVMNKGRIEQIGSPLEVYKRPANQFVAGFIGSPPMNFLPARVARSHAHPQKGIAFDTARLGMPPHSEKAVTIGIRPEHVAVGTDGALTLPLHVDTVENLGADTLVHGRLGDESATTFTARLPGSQGVRPGDWLPLTAAPDHVHLFASDSGMRLRR